MSLLGSAAFGGQSAGGILVLVIGIAVSSAITVYLMLRLALFYYLIIDREAGVFDSLQESSRLTSNRTGTLILVYLLTIVITLAGLLALCVGIIFAAPLTSLMVPVTYVAITGTGPRPPEKGDLIWEDGL